MSTVAVRKAGWRLWAAAAVALAGHAGQAFSQATTNSPAFERGFQQRSAEIRGLLEERSAQLDEAFDFSGLVVDGQLPPEMRKLTGPNDVDTMHPDAGRYQLVQLPLPCQRVYKGCPCEALNWRIALMNGLTVLPKLKLTSDMAQSPEFKRGQDEADWLAESNLKRLDGLYKGMRRARDLERRGLIVLHDRTTKSTNGTNATKAN